MPPSASHNPPKAGLSAHGQGPEDVFNEFVSVFGRFCTDKGFQRLKAMILEHDTLQKKVDDITTAYDKNLGELTRLIADRNADTEAFEKRIDEQTKQHSKVMEDKAAAYRKLNAEQDTVTKLKGKIKSLEEDVGRSIANSKKHEERAAKLESTIREQQEQLATAKKESATLTDKLRSTIGQFDTQSQALTRAEGDLATFRSYTATLTPLRDVRVGISEFLGSSFKDALALFKGFLGREVDEDRMHDSRSWDRVRDHVAIQRAIPLPVSNSTDAKQMRTIAGLVIYARALSEYVFRPTYLSLGTSADDVLDALPAANAFQDSLVRAMLLKVLPEQQKTRQDDCAERVVEEVLTAVAGWVPTDQHATFRSQLRHLTSVLCSNWQRVQRLCERVEPCFAFETPDDWQLMSSWTDPVASDNRAKIAPLRHQELEPAALSADDVAKVVWPAFLATSVEQPADEEESPSDLVRHGIVLTRAEIQGAKDEESSRRARRKVTRDSDPTALKRRRDSAVFLSRGGSDRLDVK
ncbi:hypothetical protein CDEST_02030 [Colletotrichum destructivum]|uniref:MEI5 protein n=1 Tax=Colletotrichum destructivum TaxID=34406 RepID=A0AAX4I0S0_9PEZI|nr:hypothetical protein CDEST_02030 [Colletotrichum destructivum]